MIHRSSRWLLSTLLVAGVLSACSAATQPSATPSTAASSAASTSASTSSTASASTSASPAVAASTLASTSPSPSVSDSASASANVTTTPTEAVTEAAPGAATGTATGVATDTATGAATDTATGEASTDTAGSFVVTPAVNGAQRVESPAAGLAVTLPAGWEVVDPKAPGVSDAVQQGLERGGFKSPIDVKALLASGVKLLAFNVKPNNPNASANNFVTNMNVLQLGNGNTPLDAIEGQAANQIKQGLGVADVQQQRIKLGSGEALRLRYVLHPPAANAPPIANTQYIFDEARGNYVLTFSTLESNQAADAPVFEQIASSFEKR